MKRIFNTVKSKIQSFQEGIACVVDDTVCPSVGILESEVTAADTNHVRDDDTFVSRGKSTYDDVIFDIMNDDDDDDAWAVRMTEEETTLRDDILEKLLSRCKCYFTSDYECNDDHDSYEALKSHGISPRGCLNQENGNDEDDEIFTKDRRNNKKRKPSSSASVAREITPIRHICQTETWDCGETITIAHLFQNRWGYVLTEFK